MEALVYEGNKTLCVRDVKKPEIKQGEVLIKVSYAGICGSDLLIWNGGYPRVTPPITIGHEFSGIIEQVGSSESEFNEGDRVVVEPLITCGICPACETGDYNLCTKLNLTGIDQNGGMAQYVSVSENQVIQIPDNVTLRDAAFTEPLAVGVHMTGQANVSANHVVLVVGGGPIGLIAASVARSKSADVYISEINDFRLNKAQELGFKTINPKETDVTSVLESITEGYGCDVAIEATGTAFGLTDCIETTKPRGTVLIGGMAKKKLEVDTYRILAKELHVTGSRVYTRKDFVEALELIKTNKFIPKNLVTHLVRLDEAVSRGFEPIEQGESVMKVLITIDKG
ncbi:Zn-dependent alcohol dehydrogenase [Lentibacillus kapialis]|uniref:Zn-dependent alcohol dehydrogenase n=1 Tax=Lentibacillus kapialis TaxID=340214 RepID=A0A917UYC9_9BACI|nr:alcohol dehydrogenase catalytic domain-containing protein [Lentibacillus kapialis]GGJ98395.1 Zn-dependent alcohol dehydrogenase [Lentibacillus kapialis]